MAKDMRKEMGLENGYLTRELVDPDSYVDKGLARKLNRAIRRIESLEYERDELAKVVGGDVELGREMREARDLVRAYREDNKALLILLEAAYEALFGGPDVELVNLMAVRLGREKWGETDE